MDTASRIKVQSSTFCSIDITRRSHQDALCNVEILSNFNASMVRMCTASDLKDREHRWRFSVLANYQRGRRIERRLKPHFRPVRPNLA